jgi:hypothetical protein
MHTRPVLCRAVLWSGCARGLGSASTVQPYRQAAGTTEQLAALQRAARTARNASTTRVRNACHRFRAAACMHMVAGCPCNNSASTANACTATQERALAAVQGHAPAAAPRRAPPGARARVREPVGHASLATTRHNSRTRTIRGWGVRGCDTTQGTSNSTHTHTHAYEESRVRTRRVMRVRLSVSLARSPPPRLGFLMDGSMHAAPHWQCMRCWKTRT